MSARRALITLPAAAAVLLAAGCLQVEKTIELTPTLSGTALVVLHGNVEPALVYVTQTERQMEGKPLATAAELDEVKRQWLDLRGQAGSADDARGQEKLLRQSLPPGLALLESSSKQDRFFACSRARVAFDHLRNLAGLVLTHDPDDPLRDPFSSFTVSDESGTVVVTGRPLNPMARVLERLAAKKLDPKTTAAIRAQTKALFKDARVVVRIAAPFTVVEHNATRQDADTLVWEYDFAALDRLASGEATGGIRVRYRR